MKKYKFLNKTNLIFINGAPISGKTTLANIVCSRIYDCQLQHMDVVRLIAQDVKNTSNTKYKNDYAYYGSTDAYKLEGEGSYTKNRLISGFKKYSYVVSSLILPVLDKLNSEDINNLIIEGVQITPDILKKELQKENRLMILVKTSEHQLSNNRKALSFDENLSEKYSNEKVLLIQEELLTQAQSIDSRKMLIIENNRKPELVAESILDYLKKKRIIK